MEKVEAYKRLAGDHGIDTIFAATPNTTVERLERIIDYTRGFLYLVSIFGITGARKKSTSTLFLKDFINKYICPDVLKICFR